MLEAPQGGSTHPVALQCRLLAFVLEQLDVLVPGVVLVQRVEQPVGLQGQQGLGQRRGLVFTDEAPGLCRALLGAALRTQAHLDCYPE